MGQNRQFRFSSSHEVRIYPIVPSTAATLLSESGFGVQYLDGINEGISWQRFTESLQTFRPDLIVMETKTPIVRVHWRIIDELKKGLPNAMFLLVGDHVSYAPMESLENSQVDFVLTGGDYDASLLALARHLENNRQPLPPGTWYRKEDDIRNTGEAKLISDLDTLPFINRELTKWWLYGEAYLHHPCTYIMWGRGCYPGSCSFCVWASNLWCRKARLRSVDNVLDEIELLVNKLHIKEIFDDTDTSTWNRRWLESFCRGVMERRLNEEVYISCNARADNLDRDTCKLMKDAGFRLLKVGLESGNDSTLQRVEKREDVIQIRRGVKNAKNTGLRVLLTIMVGYPWEEAEDVQRTVELARELMLYKTHVGDSLQASVVVPYPGTPMFFECLENNWFRVDPNDYESFDMSMPILKSPLKPSEIMEYCDKLWCIHMDPKFVAKTFTSVRSINDVKMLWRGLRSVFGHIKDF